MYAGKRDRRLSVDPIGTNFSQRDLWFCGQTIEQLNIAVLHQATCRRRRPPFVPGGGLPAVQGVVVADDVDAQEPEACRVAMAERYPEWQFDNEFKAKRDAMMK